MSDPPSSPESGPVDQRGSPQPATDSNHALSHREADVSQYQSPPRKNPPRKLGDTEFSDSPRIVRAWSARREQHNAGMADRAERVVAAGELPDGMVAERTEDGALAGSGERDDPFDFTAVVERGGPTAASPAVQVGAATSDDAAAAAPQQQRATAQRTAQAIVAEVLKRPAHPAAGEQAAPPPPLDVAAAAPATGQMARYFNTGARLGTPPFPPSGVAQSLQAAKQRQLQTAATSTSRPPAAQGGPARAPGGFLSMETEESFERRTGTASARDGEEGMDVDGPEYVETRNAVPAPPGAQGHVAHQAATQLRDAPPHLPAEEAAVDEGWLDADAQDPGDPADDPIAHIHNPAPSSEDDRAGAARYSAAFARTLIKIAALRRAHPCTDGHLAGARAANLNPSSAAKWKARRAAGEPGVGAQVYSIGGDTNVAGMDPARVKIEVQEALQLMLPGETPRVAPALGVYGGTPMPPGTFNVDSVLNTTAAVLKNTEFLVLGRICMTFFDWDHGNSNFMGTFTEAVYKPDELAEGLKKCARNSPELRAFFFRTLESRFPGCGTPGRVRFIDSIKASPITVTPRDATWIEYDVLNVHAETAGLIPPDEHGRPQELPSDLIAPLREAFSTLYVHEDDIGRAVMRADYACLICTSKSHPSGRCPALTLEGWPRRHAQDTGAQGPAAQWQPIGGTQLHGAPTRGAFRGRGTGPGRGGGLGRGAPPARGMNAGRGHPGRGGAGHQGWSN